jgi:hypothetical protein
MNHDIVGVLFPFWGKCFRGFVWDAGIFPLFLWELNYWRSKQALIVRGASIGVSNNIILFRPETDSMTPMQRHAYAFCTVVCTKWLRKVLQRTVQNGDAFLDGRKENMQNGSSLLTCIFSAIVFNVSTPPFPKPEVPHLEMHYEMHCS